MKHLIIALAALTSLTASAQLGVDAMAKQRARDAANQNNNRSLNPPGATPALAARPVATAPTVSATSLNPAQQAFASFQSELLVVSTNATPQGKQELTKDLANVAQGANKPSQATLSKLTDHLTTALAETKLSKTQKTQLARDVGVLLNSAATSAVQKQAIIKDAQSILQSGGSSPENAAAVAADLQTVTDEVKPAAK